MNEEFQNLIKTLKQVTLSSHEKREIKSLVFEHIKEESALTKMGEQVSGYGFLDMFRSHALAFATMFFVIFAGTGVTFGAESALPGDVLYSVKLHVNEGLRSAVVFNPTQKARWNSRRAERRLEEAQELAEQGRLDEEAENVIENNFASHTSEVYEALDEIERRNDVVAALGVVSELESLLSAHQEILVSRLATRTRNEEVSAPRTLKEFQENKQQREERLAAEKNATNSQMMISAEGTSEDDLSKQDNEGVTISGLPSEGQVASGQGTILDLLEENLESLTKNRVDIENRLNKVSDSKLEKSAIRSQRKARVAVAGFDDALDDASFSDDKIRQGFKEQYINMEEMTIEAKAEMESGNYSKAITIFNQISSKANRAETIVDAHLELENIKETKDEIEAQINGNVGDTLGSSTSTSSSTSTNQLENEKNIEVNASSSTSTPKQNSNEGGSDEEVENQDAEEQDAVETNSSSTSQNRFRIGV